MALRSLRIWGEGWSGMTDFEPQTLEKPSSFSLWLNWLPIFHIATGLLLTLWMCHTTSSRLGILVAWIYLLPPLASRLMITIFGNPEGRLTQDVSAYRVWWVLTQLQILFNRLPWLEELLRLLPGLYALWIRLWGGRLSPFAYVGPGVQITDRHAIHVGRGAVLGMNSLLTGHLVIRDEKGRWQVLVAAPVVEPGAIVGGAAKLGPGALLRAGSMLPVGRHIMPFEEWPRRKIGTNEE